MAYKFEQLDVWKISLDYSDLIYELADKLPDHEKFNLKSQELAKRLFAFRKALKSNNKTVGEETAVYDTDLFE